MACRANAIQERAIKGDIVDDWLNKGARIGSGIAEGGQHLLRDGFIRIGDRALIEASLHKLHDGETNPDQ